MRCYMISCAVLVTACGASTTDRGATAPLTRCGTPGDVYACPAGHEWEMERGGSEPTIRGRCESPAGDVALACVWDAHGALLAEHRPSPTTTSATASPSVAPTGSASPSPSPTFDPVCRASTCEPGQLCAGGRCLDPTPTPSPTLPADECADDPGRVEHELCRGGVCPEGIGEPGLVVQLTWDRPGDLELVMTRASAPLLDCADSCWYGNCDPLRRTNPRCARPDWCDPASVLDDPVMTSGRTGSICGPELIRIPEPCDDSVDVWALRYSSSSGVVPVRMRVFCGGVLRAEIDARLDATTDVARVWRAARITLPSCVVATIDVQGPECEMSPGTCRP